jgi:hypothetical protein
MTKNQTHEWRERTEDGGKRFRRARWDSRQWRFSVLEPDADDWERIEPPGADDYQALRGILWNKYQRRRIPFKYIEGIDRILRDEFGIETV